MRLQTDLTLTDEAIAILTDPAKLTGYLPKAVQSVVGNCSCGVYTEGVPRCPGGFPTIPLVYQLFDVPPATDSVFRGWVAGFAAELFSTMSPKPFVKFHRPHCPSLAAIRAALGYLRDHLDQLVSNNIVQHVVSEGITNLLLAPTYLPEDDYKKIEGGLLICNTIPQTVISPEFVTAVEHAVPGLQVVAYDQWAILETAKVYDVQPAELVALPVFTALQTSLKAVWLGEQAPVMTLLPD